MVSQVFLISPQSVFPLNQNALLNNISLSTFKFWNRRPAEYLFTQQSIDSSPECSKGFPQFQQAFYSLFAAASGLLHVHSALIKY